MLPLHELLHMLAWLEGIWVTEEPATAMYPTMKSFNYYDGINITSIGQPVFNYIAQSWHPETGTPMHRETGFLQILPGTNKIVLSLIGNIGIFTVEEGELMNDTKTIDLRSTNLLATDAWIPTFSPVMEVQFLCKKLLIIFLYLIVQCLMCVFFFDRHVEYSNSMVIVWN